MFLLILSALTACTSPPITLMPLAQVPTIASTTELAISSLTMPDAPEETALSSPSPASASLTATPPSSPIPLALPYPTPPEAGMPASDVVFLLPAPIPSASEIMEWRPPCVPVPHSLHPNDHYWLRRPIPSGKVDWGLDWYHYGSNGLGQWRMHHGMDFPNDPGTPVLAAGDGVVIWVTDGWVPIYVSIDEEKVELESDEEQTGESEEDQSEQDDEPEEEKPKKWVLGPYGNYIIIRHDWGWQGQPVYSLYGHLLEVFVQEGDHVRAGDLIAGVGNTGASSGPHLHLEVRVGENDYYHTVNPALWLAPYEGWGTLAGQITSASGTFLYNAVLTISPAHRGDELEDSDIRVLTSYANDQVNPDSLWGENFVVSDLPAGEYQLSVRAGGEILKANVTIRMGATTLIKLHTRSAPAVVPIPTSTPPD